MTKKNVLKRPTPDTCNKLSCVDCENLPECRVIAVVPAEDVEETRRRVLDVQADLFDSAADGNSEDR